MTYRAALIRRALRAVVGVSVFAGAICVEGALRVSPVSAGAARVPAGGVVEVFVPEAVGGKVVAGNLAVDQQGGAGFVTAYPCGEAKPLSSDLNFLSRNATSNRFVGHAGQDGRICFSPSVATHIIFDAEAILNGAASFPNRRTDTREMAGGKPIPARTVLEVTVPEAIGGKVVIGNLAVDGQWGPGFVTAYACGEPMPEASDLNFVAGATSNRFIGRASQDGRICLFPSRTTHIIFDANGLLADAVPFANRRTDSRTSAPGAMVPANGTLKVTVPEAVGGKVVVGNLAVDMGVRAGFVTGYPCNEPAPAKSDLNFPEFSAASNRFVGRANQNGEICFTPNMSRHIIFDANAIVSDAAPFAHRRTDTRSQPDVPACLAGQLTVVADPRPSVGTNRRIDVRVTNNGPPCSLDDYPTVAGVGADGSVNPLQATHRSFFALPLHVSSIVTGETVLAVLSGSLACPEYTNGRRQTWAQFRFAVPSGTTIQVASDLDTTCGVAITTFGANPDLIIPDVPQPTSGDGWRLLTDQPRRGWPFDVHVARNPAEYETLWASLGLAGEPDAVDFTREIVVHFGAVYSGSCPEIRLVDVLLDVAGFTIAGDIVTLGGPRICTADAGPRAYLVAIPRDRLPPVPFTVELNRGCPNCTRITVTDLAGDPTPDPQLSPIDRWQMFSASARQRVVLDRPFGGRSFARIDVLDVLLRSESDGTLRYDETAVPLTEEERNVITQALAPRTVRFIPITEVLRPSSGYVALRLAQPAVREGRMTIASSLWCGNVCAVGGAHELELDDTHTWVVTSTHGPQWIA